MFFYRFTRHAQEVEQLRPQGVLPVQEHTRLSIFGFDDDGDDQSLQAFDVLILQGDRGWVSWLGGNNESQRQHTSILSMLSDMIAVLAAGLYN